MQLAPEPERDDRRDVHAVDVRADDADGLDVVAERREALVDAAHVGEDQAPAQRQVHHERVQPARELPRERVRRAERERQRAQDERGAREASPLARRDRGDGAGRGREVADGAAAGRWP